MSLVGLVVVSHSARLAEGVVEVAAQMAPDVAVLAAGGTADGGIGTDLDAVSAALTSADAGAGVVLLYDLGSARMVAEMAVELLADPDRAALVDAPLVEGAVAAAVAAQGGGDLTGVAAAARTALTTTDGPSAAAELQQAPRTEEVPVLGRFRLTNDIGLHARPAALLARTLAGLDASVTVRFGGRAADATSVLALMSLGARGGDEIEVSAVGPRAQEALGRVAELVERDFDD
ncbi:dihydroxyacetone kinase phosphoryl donor subunit DhaM [Actinophytocola xanthii]|uniref:Phosphocarrier protein HPr n=1 Tax=Actinophytocola xanthii TaxID=1912961 RepID=A0A1Q8CGH8_9PSEU|nr:dihydroxyacetone kinase phosphoryl donor subunit DhaM [Actinophytocola xanthii]OLF13501.1 PTS sugar transporter subunit IIA [Actinophytocola xanthii]